MFFFILVLICVGIVIWTSVASLKAFEKFPEVGQILKKSFKKQPNRMKIYNFSEYPLVVSNGFIFEVIETTKRKGRIWTIKINVFNANDEVKKVRLVRTGFKWKNHNELFINDNNYYTVKSSTGLVSSSQMIVWSVKKPESISITYTSNDEPGSVFIDLSEEREAVKKMNQISSAADMPLNNKNKNKVANETSIIENKSKSNDEQLDNPAEKDFLENLNKASEDDSKIIDNDNHDEKIERNKNDDKE